VTELTDEAAEARFDAPLPDEQAVMAMLAALPPVTMPRELSDSISAALAAESATRTAGAATDSEEPLAEVIDLRSRRGVWVGAVAGIAAAAVALAGAAYVMRPHNAAVVGDLGPVLASGSDYSTSQLSSEVPQLLTNAGLGATPGDSTARVAPADAAVLQNTFAATPDGIRSCVAQLSSSGDVTVVAIDMATYQGSPAAVVVTKANGATDLTATVVAPTCGTSGPEVLAQTTVTAP
jgi:hypothetical protein